MLPFLSLLQLGLFPTPHRHPSFFIAFLHLSPSKLLLLLLHRRFFFFLVSCIVCYTVSLLLRVLNFDFFFDRRRRARLTKLLVRRRNGRPSGCRRTTKLFGRFPSGLVASPSLLYLLTVPFPALPPFPMLAGFVRSFFIYLFFYFLLYGQFVGKLATRTSLSLDKFTYLMLTLGNVEKVFALGCAANGFRALHFWLLRYSGLMGLWADP